MEERLIKTVILYPTYDDHLNFLNSEQYQKLKVLFKTFIATKVNCEFSFLTEWVGTYLLYLPFHIMFLTYWTFYPGKINTINVSLRNNPALLGLKIFLQKVIDPNGLVTFPMKNSPITWR